MNCFEFFFSFDTCNFFVKDQYCWESQKTFSFCYWACCQVAWTVSWPRPERRL